MQNKQQLIISFISYFCFVILSIIIIIFNIATISLNEKNTRLTREIKRIEEANEVLYMKIVSIKYYPNLELIAKKLGFIPLTEINYIKIKK